MWHSYLAGVPRLTRYTLGVRIDNLFAELVQVALSAQYAKRSEKLALLEKLSHIFDNLKYFITILWEAKAIDANKHAQLSQRLARVGTMLGGWISSLKKETLPL